MRTKAPVSPATLLLAVAGVTQRDVAERCGVSPTTIGEALAGRRRMPVRLPIALVDLLGSEDAALDVLAAIPNKPSGDP